MKSLSARIISLVALLSALAYFGLDFSAFRPVWAYEHEALAKDFYAEKCYRLKSEWYRAKESESEYKRNGEPIPRWLLDRLLFLEHEMALAGCK